VFGSNYFPGVSIYNVLGQYQPVGVPIQAYLNIGPNAESQSANTGVFQNRLAPSGNAIWILGKHTLSFGASYTYTQLNTIDKRTGKGTIATDDFSQFLQGYVTPGSSASGFYVTSFLQGDASRYYRANQLGTYLQDKYQVTPHLSLTIGVRYDWDGGLTEKYGRIFNFDPKYYGYTASNDSFNGEYGLIIAGNNANGTSGVSPTTLTGRQWGVGPRVGAAWQPSYNHNTVVFRTGAGIYYDRGELFSYFSPGYAIGTVTGGPFGVNQQLPFVNSTTCPSASLYYYENFQHLRATSRTRMASHRYPLPAIPKPRISPIFSPRPATFSMAANPSHSVSTTAPTSFRTPSTTQWISSGSRATTWPSILDTWAIWDAIRSFQCPSINRTSLPNPALHLLAAPTPRLTVTVIPSRARRDAAAGLVPRSICPTTSPISKTTRGEMWTFAFPTSVTQPSPSPIELPASMPTTLSRRTSKST
jgi:hypothetical protein